MEKKEIIILIACLVLVGFSLYRKYMKKSEGDKKTGTQPGSGTLLSSRQDDDDYEPYSGKK